MRIEPVAGKAAFAISWPNVVRIDRVYRPWLRLDWEPPELDAGRTPRLAELAPVLDGKPNMTQVDAIDLERLAREYRTQRIVFEAARDVYDVLRTEWSGSREVLLAQIVRLVEEFVRSDHVVIEPRLFLRDGLMSQRARAPLGCSSHSNQSSLSSGARSRLLDSRPVPQSRRNTDPCCIRSEPTVPL